MWEGKSRELWVHTSALMSQAYNLNRGKNDPGRRPADFDPWTRIDERRSGGVDNIDRLTRDWAGLEVEDDLDGPARRARNADGTWAD